MAPTSFNHVDGLLQISDQIFPEGNPEIQSGGWVYDFGIRELALQVYDVSICLQNQFRCLELARAQRSLLGRHQRWGKSSKIFRVVN